MCQQCCVAAGITATEYHHAVCCVLVQLVDRCPFAVCFMSALEKSCSLHQLVHYQQRLQQLQQHVLQGATLAAHEAMCGCPALVKVRPPQLHYHVCQ